MIKIMTLPFNPDQEGFDDEPLNRFLLGKTLHTIHAELFQQHGKTYWTVWLDYEPVISASEKKAIRTVSLSEPQKALLTALQKWRKEWAEQHQIPVFIVATNKELEDIAVLQPKTLESLKTVQGFGHKKTEKYGQAILALVQQFVTTDSIKTGEAHGNP